MLDGIIYKVKRDAKPPKNVGTERHNLENLKQLQDVSLQLATIQGTAIDRPIIGDVPYSDWAGTYFADPIPAELALPSDVRFREDLICLKRGEKGKGKVWMNNLSKKQQKDTAKKNEPSEADQSTASGTEQNGHNPNMNIPRPKKDAQNN